MEEGVAVKAAAPPTAVRAIAAESFMVEVVVVKDLCQVVLTRMWKAKDSTEYSCGVTKNRFETWISSTQDSPSQPRLVVHPFQDGQHCHWSIHKIGKNRTCVARSISS